jgi:DNA polymerase I
MHLLIDGKNLVYRAFYGMPELTRASDGFPTGAIYGWCKALWRLQGEYVGQLEVFWDAGSRARVELDADYKANRKPIPEPMKAQLPIIERLTTQMGVPSYKEPGSEADDLLASRAWALADAGDTVLIVSADKDFAQCVNERINLLTPPPTVNPKDPWKRYGREQVIEKFGVSPEQIAEYLALMGDSSDNVQGIDGVGPKTAADWLKSYKTIQGIIDNCGKLNPKRFQNIIYEQQALLHKNIQLTTLKRRTLPDQLLTPGALDGAAVVALLKELEMKSSADEAVRRYEVGV